MSSTYDLISAKNGTYFRETWVGNDAVADATIGQNDWEIETIGNASTYALQTALNGVLQATTAATANGDGSALRLFTDGLVMLPNVWFRAAILRPVELASLNFRVGFDDSVTATRPTKGITFESDAGVLTCANDSAANGDHSIAVTKHPDLTSGTTEVVAAWTHLEFRGSGNANANGGPAHVQYKVNGTVVATLPCLLASTETVEAKLIHWQDAGAADAVIVQFGYVEGFIPRAY